MFLGRISLKNAFIFPGTPFESRKVRFKIENPSAPENQSIHKLLDTKRAGSK
jgi:hypothetical protein